MTAHSGEGAPTIVRMLDRLSPFRIDPELPIDRAARRRIQRRADKLMKARPLHQLVTDTAVGLGFVLLWCIAVFTIFPLFDGGRLEWVTFFSPPVLFGGIWFFVWIWIFARGKPFLRQAMLEAGYDFCFGCGYDLRGALPGAQRCPECGAARTQFTPTR